MHKLSLILFLATGFAAVTALTAQAGPQAPARVIQAQALDRQPETRVEAGEAMDGSIAAAVIGAVAEQFEEGQVVVKLDTIAVDPASIRDRAVSGSGRLQMGGDAAWIPFKFQAQYDTNATTVSYPRLVIGGAASTRTVANDSAIAKTLSTHVAAKLKREFAQQRATLLMEHLTASAAGERYLLVAASGGVDFGRDGSTPTKVEGLYDLKTAQWIRVDYELGETASWSPRATDTSVAVR